MVRFWPQTSWKVAAPSVATIKNNPTIANSSSLIFCFVSMFVSSFAFLSFSTRELPVGRTGEARDDIEGLCCLLAQSIVATDNQCQVNLCINSQKEPSPAWDTGRYKRLVTLLIHCGRVFFVLPNRFPKGCQLGTPWWDFSKWSRSNIAETSWFGFPLVVDPGCYGWRAC